MIPQVLGIIKDLFPAEQMGKAIGVYGPVMGLSAMLGPIVAGGLIGADLFGTDWRMIFLVNLPIGAFALIIGARLLPSAEHQQTRARLDIPGALIAGAGMFLLVYPLVEGHALGWPPYLFVMMAASVLVLGGFGWYQLRRQRAGATPLVDPAIFANRSYTSGLLFAVVFIAALGGIVLIFNVFLQEGLGFSPWHSALSTAPWAGGAFVGAAVAGMTLARLGRKIVHIGLVIETVGLVGVILVLRTSGPAGQHAGPAGPDDRRRARHGHGVRAAVRHHPGRRQPAGDRLGLRCAADGQLARHGAGRGRPGRGVLRPARRPGLATPRCSPAPRSGRRH